MPVLKGGTITAPRDLYFVRREGGPAYGGKSYEAIIRGDWKLHAERSRSARWNSTISRPTRRRQTNLAATNKKMFNELAAALRGHIQRGGATPWQKPPRGHSP